MKKFKWMLLASVVAFGLAACGGGGGGGGDTSTPATNPSNGGTTSTTSNTTPPPPPQPTPSTTANQVPIVAGGQNFNMVNRLYVSVTVCAPGTTTCETIPDVIVDSGSYGLRLYASAIPPALLNALPTVQTSSGSLNECSMFAGGNLWGSVRTADVQMAGEVAKAMPLQVIDDGAYSVPSACSSTGTMNQTPSSFGGNGLIGVGPQKQDCGAYCTQYVSNPYYYACANGTCTQTSVPVQQQVVNPVSVFSSDNNGVLIELPAVPPHGASSAPGTMTFGIDTQANNTLANKGVATYTMQRGGSVVNGSYNGTSMPVFFDTGSGMNYFSDSSIPVCPNHSLFCPTSDLSLSAQVQGFNGASTSVPFTVGNGTSLMSQYPIQYAIPALSGTSDTNQVLSGSFDFGLPFFFGRTVGFLFDGEPSATATGPAVAF